MLKAFAGLGNFRQASKFSTWLYRIVYNTALTKMNSRKRSTVNIDEHKEAGRLTNNDNREWDLLVAAERRKYVSAALDRLKADERTIITLYYIAEKNISEICEITDLKKSAVKMRLLRGRKQLEYELKLLLNDELKEWL